MARRSERAYGDGRVFRPKGSRKYMVAWYVNGKEVRRSAKTESETKAEDFRRKVIGDKVDGRPVPAKRGCTFEDMAAMLENDYVIRKRRSLGGAKRSIGHLQPFFGGMQAVDITSDRVDAYIAARLEQKAAPATVRLEIAALSKMFSLARKKGRVAVRPDFTRLAVENTRTDAFSEDELDAVLDVLMHGRPATAMEPGVRAQPDLVPPIMFAAVTGWRIRSEVLPLRWKQVDLEAGTAWLERGTTKNGLPRVFPVGAVPALAAMLQRQREATTALERETHSVIPWVFHRRGRPIRNLNDAWTAACRRAGVPGRWLHDLRRTAARALRALGMSDRDIAEACGWETVVMVSRYLGKDPFGVADRLRLRLAEAEARKGTREAR